MYEQEESSDEASNFRSKVQTLRHVALEISEELKNQNKDLQDLQPGFENKILHILRNVKLVKNIKPQYLRTWIYYVGGTIVISLVFFILFVLT